MAQVGQARKGSFYRELGWKLGSPKWPRHPTDYNLSTFVSRYASEITRIEVLIQNQKRRTCREMTFGAQRGRNVSSVFIRIEAEGS